MRILLQNITDGEHKKDEAKEVKEESILPVKVELSLCVHDNNENVNMTRIMFCLHNIVSIV